MTEQKLSDPPQLVALCQRDGDGHEEVAGWAMVLPDHVVGYVPSSSGFGRGLIHLLLAGLRSMDPWLLRHLPGPAHNHGMSGVPARAGLLLRLGREDGGCRTGSGMDGGAAAGATALATLQCLVPSTALLTADDLDEIGHVAFTADQPLELAAELVGAVDQSRVADQSETGYALTLAAEITERNGDLQGALALVERAIEANLVHGQSYGFPQAFRAQLLLRLGREDEAMAQLRALRPLLCQDPDAVRYVSEALEAEGRAETAEQWLTEALSTALEDSQEPPAPARNAGVRECGSGGVRVGPVATYAQHSGDDPTDRQVRENYLQGLTDPDLEIAWPPGRQSPVLVRLNAEVQEVLPTRTRT
jgi:hypothetical protein